MRRIAMLAAVAALWGCGGEEEPEPYEGEVACVVTPGRGQVCIPAPVTEATCLRLPTFWCGEHMAAMCEDEGKTCQAVYVLHRDSTEEVRAWVADERCLTDAEYRSCY